MTPISQYRYFQNNTAFLAVPGRDLTDYKDLKFVNADLFLSNLLFLWNFIAVETSKDRSYLLLFPSVTF